MPIHYDTIEDLIFYSLNSSKCLATYIQAQALLGNKQARELNELFFFSWHSAESSHFIFEHSARYIYPRVRSLIAALPIA